MFCCFLLTLLKCYPSYSYPTIKSFFKILSFGDCIIAYHYLFCYIYIDIFQVICHFWPLLKSVMKIPVCHSDYFLRLISCKWKLWVCIFLIFMAYIATFFRKIIPVWFSSLRVCEICVSLHSCQYLVVSFLKKLKKKVWHFKKQTWHLILFCIFD